jgi:hypothetical protein
MRRVVLVLLLGLMPATVDAQYVGRNKVQYKKFDFQVLHTDRFDTAADSRSSCTRIKDLNNPKYFPYRWGHWAAKNGPIQLNNVLADYRRYFMPARFYTLAVRALHFGRYGRDAENPIVAFSSAIRAWSAATT